MATVDVQAPSRPAAGPDAALQKGRELVRLWSEIETALEQYDSKRRRLQVELALASTSVPPKVAVCAFAPPCKQMYRSYAEAAHRVSIIIFCPTHSRARPVRAAPPS